MVRVLALVTSLVLAGPLAAFAQAAAPEAAAAADAEIYARDGFYVGASLAGVSFMRLADSIDRHVTDFTGDASQAKSETTMGVNFRVGYRMHPRVAAEAQWEWLVPSDVALTLTDDDTGEFLTDDSAFKVGTWTVTANLKGYLLTKGDIQPFLLLGGGILKGDLDGRSAYGFAADGFSFLGRMGGGLEYYFTPHIVAVVDLTYVLPTGNLKDFPYISGGLGLQYRF
jgi:opacity protein-like surface antigen